MDIFFLKQKQNVFDGRNAAGSKAFMYIQLLSFAERRLRMFFPTLYR